MAPTLAGLRRAAIGAAATFVTSALLAGTAAAQSLEAETRRPPGTSSLQDDSERLRGQTADQPGTNSLDNDSMQLRGRTADQDGTNSLDDGSPDDGDDVDDTE